MSHIRQLIERLRERSDLGIIEQEQSWLVVIMKDQDLIYEVTAPNDVLEWFACVKERGKEKEVWSDWMDYSGYDERPWEELEAEMAADILAFVDRVSVSEPWLLLRIYEEKT